MLQQPRRIVKIWQLGKISYAKSLKLQKYLTDLHFNPQESIPDTILCLEYDPVYTVGIRGKIYTPEDEIKLKNKGAEFFRTDRGGLITFHGPGQLVVYPILNLRNFKPSMRWYVCGIERTIIDLCGKFKLKAETSPHTGVWVGDNKICAIGIHGSRFITTHGLALNCNNDLGWFDHIVPCGIENKGVTSLSKELNDDVSIDDVLPMFLSSFSQVFGCDYVNYPIGQTKSILDNL